MITCIFGLPGAGKSSYLAYSAQRASQGKRLFCGFRPFWDISLGTAYPYQRIYSNFPIAGCYKFDWEMVGTFDFSNSLILIDEIMQLCDSRDWKNFGAEKKYFFSMHRHYKTDIIYCSQMYDDVDRKIRNLTELVLLIQNVGPFSRVSPIAKSIAVSGKIDENFQQCAPIQSGFILRSKYYHLFNSYAAKKMPENPSLLWEIPPKPKKKRGILLAK